MSKVRMRIRLVDGRWLAFASGGLKRIRNGELAVAISFCKRLNDRRKRNITRTSRAAP